jgi:hypothetical protein
MQLLDLPSELFVPGEREGDDTAVWDVTVALKTGRNGTVLLPVWTTEVVALSVWLGLPSPPPVIRVPTWSTVLDLACRRSAHALYLDPMPDEPVLADSLVDTTGLDPARVLPLLDDSELWPIIMAHLEAGGIHRSFDLRLRAHWEMRRSIGWTEFWEIAVRTANAGEWKGNMACRSCSYRWRSLQPAPPARCPACSSTELTAVRECPEIPISME